MYDGKHGLFWRGKLVAFISNDTAFFHPGNISRTTTPQGLHALASATRITVSLRHFGRGNHPSRRENNIAKILIPHSETTN
jgi:hypothetical protein